MHVGLAGAGRIGAFHATVLNEAPQVTRLSVADVDAPRARRLAAAVGAGHYDSAEELIDSDLDAIVIAAATPAHAALLHRAIDAGVAAFCEKPIALDLPATDSVVEHVSRKGAFVQLGFQRRFDAGYRAAREAVRSDRVGVVYLVRLAGHDPAPPPEQYIADSGGIFRDLCIHDFDVAPWVLGQQVSEVYADGFAHDPVFERHGDADAAGAVLRFDGGTLGILSALRHDPRGYDIRMELFGSRDTVSVGLAAKTPMRSLEPGVAEPSQPGYQDFMERFREAYRAELDAFLTCVSAGGESPCRVEDGRRALLVALAADRSRRERRPVAVSEVA